MTTTPVSLPGEDLAELIELLEWIHDWFALDRDGLAAASLQRYSYGLFTLDELRRDLGRFAFLLGGDLPITNDDDQDDEEDWL